MSGVRILRVDDDPARWDAGVRALEAEAWYPLGDDRFQIDHGSDYFAFFRRLGELHYYVAEAGGEVVAVGAGVLRRLPLREGGAPREAWYLGDLKVRRDWRGRRLPLQMLTRAFPFNYLRCGRGYGITMNPASGRNRVVGIFERFTWAPVSIGTTLELFSLEAEAMRAARARVEAHRGPVTFLSLAGKKDIVLERTGRMPLLHVQFGPAAEPGLPEPVVGHVHMLCAPTGDPLALALRALGHAPSGTATVLQHRMGEADWRFVLTSDI